MVDFGPLHRAAQAELLSGTNECCHLQGVILVIDAADQAQLSDAKGIVQRLQAHTDLEVCPVPWLSMCTAAEQREGVCCLLLLGQQAGPTFRRCWSGCTCVRFLEWQKLHGLPCHLCTMLSLWWCAACNTSLFSLNCNCAEQVLSVQQA